LSPLFSAEAIGIHIPIIVKYYLQLFADLQVVLGLMRTSLICCAKSCEYYAYLYTTVTCKTVNTKCLEEAGFFTTDPVEYPTCKIVNIDGIYY
jgi:hypothetical protein